MRFLLSDARTFLAPYVDAGTTDEDKIDSRINEATQHLITVADWKLISKRARFWIPKGVDHVTLPQSIEKIIVTNIDKTPANAFSEYYEFMQGGPGSLTGLADVCAKDLIDLGGGHATFSDPPLVDKDGVAFTTPLKMIALSTDADDTNLTINVRGRGKYNNPLINDAGQLGEEMPIVRWVDGIEGALPSKIASTDLSSNGYKWVDQINKPVTKGHVTIYAYNPDFTTGVDGEPMLYYIGKYHSWDTVPSLRRYKITANVCSTYVTSLVKLAYVPVALPNDPLLIQSLIAMKAMIQGLNYYDDDNQSMGEAKEAMALRILDNQLNDTTQDTNEFTVEDNFALGQVRTIV